MKAPERKKKLGKCLGGRQKMRSLGGTEAEIANKKERENAGFQSKSEELLRKVQLKRRSNEKVDDAKA